MGKVLQQLAVVLADAIADGSDAVGLPRAEVILRPPAHDFRRPAHPTLVERNDVAHIEMGKVLGTEPLLLGAAQVVPDADFSTGAEGLQQAPEIQIMLGRSEEPYVWKEPR